MGRPFRRNKKPRKDGEKPVDDRDRQQKGEGYEAHSFVRENAFLEAYYRMQELIPEEDFPRLMESMREGLPSTFRLTGTRQTSAAVQEHLEKVLIPSLPRVSEDGTPCPVPEPIAWYPGGLAWNMKNDRRAIRSQPAYARFHDWLKAAMEHGDISRQEAVSMIPPLLMDVRPEHVVLDLCAAPGSKTSQLVEAMHAACSPGQLPTGIVIANDVDQKRAYLLHHQVKRILSPCLMVTNNDGTLFPNLYAAGSDEPLRFDRILADVPCTGDGTIRKNPGVWKEWAAGQALGLHPLQVRLLERAVAMVRVGGRIVYSTCSMNPIEDEAVIAAVLARSAGRVRLVDCSAELAGLERLPGVPSWKVIARDCASVYGSHEDVPEGEKSRFPLTAFPQPEYGELQLERCMRVLPHLQNTGGFFIAVLEKVEETGSATRHHRKPEDEEAASRQGFYLNPNEGEYRLIDTATHPNLLNITQQYGIDPAALSRHGCAFVSKSQTAPLKNIVMVSATMARLMQAPNERLRVVNLGARAFEVYDVSMKRQFSCPYRILTESAPLFEELQLVTRRRLEIPASLAITLINHDDSVPLEDLHMEPEMEAAMRAVEEGGVLLVARVHAGHAVVVPSWKGEKSVKAFVPKPNRPALLYQLGVHDQ